MLIYQIVQILSALVSFYEWLVIIWCVLSWLPIGEGTLIGDIAQVIDRVVRPFVGIFRRFIPPIAGIDFSPVVAMLALSLIERFAIGALYALL